jgi:hypothetical protein
VLLQMTWLATQQEGADVSQQVRFAPNSLDVVYVSHGYVTISRADGGEVVIAPGHHPAWEDAFVVAFCPPEDGVVQLHDIVDGKTWAHTVPAGNTLTGNEGKVAVHRTDPRRVLTSWGHEYGNVTDPVLSADGAWLAMLAPDNPREGVSKLMLRRGDTLRDLYVGAPLRPRFSHTGTSLCWEEAGGQILGIADVANPSSPVVRLSRPEDSLSHPVPLWVPGVGLFVLYVQSRGGDEGWLYLAEWGSCVAQQPMGYGVSISGGSGYDQDVCAVEQNVRVAYLRVDGTLARAKVPLTDSRGPLPLPPVPPAPEPPDPDRWSFVPDGTLVTGAIETLIGANPVRQGEIICLHKNTFPECEWRRVDFDGIVGELLLHWADASRFPGDRGWWIEPAPTWCLDTFKSGEKAVTEHATLVDFHNSKTNRWRQTNTMYGIKGGGVCIQFDPRFPGQYTDMSKQGTAQWAPAGYEKQWTRNDGWSKWQYIVTPLTAKGVIPWGDPSMDIVIQSVESGPQPPGAPLPFVPCPRPLEPVTPQPPETDMTHDDIRRYISELDDKTLFGAMERFHNEVLPRDRPMDSLILSAEGSNMWTGDVVTGGANGYMMRSYISEYIIHRDMGRNKDQANGDGYDKAIASYNKAVGITPPVTQAPFRGPISAEGRDFVAPV